MSPGYYEQGLAAERLQRCYELAPPRTRQYLEGELAHVVGHVHPDDIVLELGCGYGRILPALCRKARLVVGIDSSRPSIELGRKLLAPVSNCRLFEMNAIDLRFPDGFFDIVVCIQNGISAFHVDQLTLIREAARVTRKGGRALFSTYSGRFWEHRLEWFRLQAEAGLVGPIDWSRTRDGTIVCTDGFTATTVGPERFCELAAATNLDATVVEVDESSLFCEFTHSGTGSAAKVRNE
jgi:SAM-dependent methyltransferase